MILVFHVSSIEFVFRFYCVASSSHLKPALHDHTLPAALRGSTRWCSLSHVEYDAH